MARRSKKSWVRFGGGEEYMAKLAKLSAAARDQVIEPAVYDGANIMTDAVRAALSAVPTDEGHYSDTKKAGPRSADKQAVLEALGISPLQNDNGFVNRKIGVNGGYYGPPTKRYPKGLPVVMLARAIRSGTSFMYPNDFVKTALRSSKKLALEKMEKRVNEEIEKIMKG